MVNGREDGTLDIRIMGIMGTATIWDNGDSHYLGIMGTATIYSSFVSSDNGDSHYLFVFRFFGRPRGRGRRRRARRCSNLLRNESVASGQQPQVDAVIFLNKEDVLAVVAPLRDACPP